MRRNPPVYYRWACSSPSVSFCQHAKLNQPLRVTEAPQVEPTEVMEEPDRRTHGRAD